MECCLFTFKNVKIWLFPQEKFKSTYIYCVMRMFLSLLHEPYYNYQPHFQLWIWKNPKFSCNKETVRVHDLVHHKRDPLPPYFNELGYTHSEQYCHTNDLLNDVLLLTNSTLSNCWPVMHEKVIPKWWLTFPCKETIYNCLLVKCILGQYNLLLVVEGLSNLSDTKKILAV